MSVLGRALGRGISEPRVPVAWGLWHRPLTMAEWHKREPLLCLVCLRWYDRWRPRTGAREYREDCPWCSVMPGPSASRGVSVELRTAC
jgi:hypothetical protein